MENKLCLWVSLIVGIPVFRLIEVFSLTRASAGGSQIDIAKHMALGLIIGVGCAMAARILKLEGRRLLLVPVLALGYAAVLFCITSPHAIFSMPAAYVSSLLVMDLTAWTIAVGGATLIGAIAMRPRTIRPVARPAIPRLDRA